MIRSLYYKILFGLFFISGFCSLVYQVVWLRLAYSAFGIITPVMSLVISVFMLGLAIGSWLGGRWISKLTQKTGMSAIFLYALAEFFIGVGAFAVPELFSYSQKVLLSYGEMDSIRYLFVSAFFIVLSLLPWCVLMGFTFPFMMSFVRENDRTNTDSFSFLYLANVVGAMSGTLLSGFVLIELTGFRTTLMTAAVLNFIIAVAGIILGFGYARKRPSTAGEINVKELPVRSPLIKGESAFILTVLFTTGFTSMSMEVVWIRAFTPVFGTYIYSFAALLTVYLAATWIGSFFYRRHLEFNKISETPTLITLLSGASFLPVVLNDPRFFGKVIPAFIGGIAPVFISIFPFCVLLGYLTPRLIDEYSDGMPYGAGVAYAVNIVGCIIGPLAASYVLLPFFGVKFSLISLAVPYIVFSMYALSSFKLRARRHIIAGIIAFVFLIFSVFVSDTFEEYYAKTFKNSVVRRDHTATVISAVWKGRKKLFVNGVGLTEQTPITKNMAHLPIFFLDRKPESALVICFGMGTTFRSLMSWDINVTAVELVPSVKDAFGYYFNDAGIILKNPKGRIIIDDGRRFLNRTKETYDVITVDPPPPVEAAGSSLLYSEEFYLLIKGHLKEGGIFQQWYPSGDEKTLNAVVRALVNSFPYVRVFKSVEWGGVHLLASAKPIKTPVTNDILSRMPEGAQRDLAEWYYIKDPRIISRSLLFTEFDLNLILNNDIKIVINDDRPFNEYYLLRRTIDRIKGVKSKAG